MYFAFCPCGLSESIKYFRLVLHVLLSSVRVLVTLVVCRRIYSVFVLYCMYFCLLSARWQLWLSVGDYTVFLSSTACIFVFCPRVDNFGCLSESMQCFCLVLHVFFSSISVLVTSVVCRRVYSIFV